MAKLTTEERKRIPAKSFALPGGRYPIEDKAHARNALSRISQFGSPGEKATVRAKVHSKFPGIGKMANGGEVWDKLKKYAYGGEGVADPDTDDDDDTSTQTDADADTDTDEDYDPDAKDTTTQPVVSQPVQGGDNGSISDKLQAFLGKQSGQGDAMQALADKLKQQQSDAGQGENHTWLNNYMNYLYGTKNFGQGYTPPPTAAQQTKANMAAQKEANAAQTPYGNSLIKLNQIQQNNQAKLRMAADKNQTARQLLSSKFGAGGEKPDKISPGQKAEDTTTGKDLSTYVEGGGQESAQAGLDALTDVRDRLLKDKSLTGGMSNYGGDTAMSIMNPAGLDAQQTVQKAILGDLKHVFGGRVTQDQMKIFLNKSYDPRLSTDDNVKRLNSTIEELKGKTAAKEDALHYWRANSGTLAGYNPIHVGAGGTGTKTVGDTTYDKVNGGWVPRSK